MVVVALLIGLAVGWYVGWRLTTRSSQKLISAQDEQNAVLLRERRESRAEVDRLKNEQERHVRMLERAEQAIANAKAKRDSQAQLIIDLTEGVSSEATAA